MSTRQSVVWIGLTIVGIGVCILIVGGQVLETDVFEPREVQPLRLPKAMVCISMPFSDKIEQDTVFRRWQRPEGIYPDIGVFAFDPTYDAISINEIIVSNNNNEIRILKPSDGTRLAFENYVDTTAFRKEYPEGDRRYVFYSLIGTENPLLSQPPAVGTKVSVRAEVEIFAKGKSVCVTNITITSEVQRQRQKTPWLWFVFVKVFRIHF